MEGRDRPCERGRPDFDDIFKTAGTMLQCKIPIWNCAKVVIMNSGFCFTKGLVELRKKIVFGAAFIKKRRYWPANIKGNAIDSHFASKEAGNVYAVKQVEDGVTYHVFCMKEPDYVKKLMTKYGTFEPMDKRTRRKFKRAGVMETKEFMYTEVVANIFLYQHKVDDNNNMRHESIYIEKTWATKYWPDRCFAWYLAVSEVNTNYARAYFQDSSDTLPQLEFMRRLAKELLENTMGICGSEGGGSYGFKVENGAARAHY